MYGKSICKYPKSVRRAVAVLGVAAGLSMAGIQVSSAQSITPEKMHNTDTTTIIDDTPDILPDEMVSYIANGERVHCAKATLVRPRAKFTGPILLPPENPYLLKSTHEVKDIIKAASFPGGYEAMKRYISKNVVYPTAVAQQGIVGTVGVEFLVRANGHIDKVRTIQSAHPLLDVEAVRLVSSMPPWEPTIVNGRKKAFYYEIYIVFYY